MGGGAGHIVVGIDTLQRKAIETTPRYIAKQGSILNSVRSLQAVVDHDQKVGKS